MYSDLKIHFLNVGHGDCTVIRHPSGRITVVDTSNGEEVDSAVIEHRLAADATKRQWYNMARAVGLSERKALAFAGAEINLTNPVEFLERVYPGESIFRYVQTHPEMDHMRGLTALEPKILNFWDTENTRSCEPRDSDKDDWQTYEDFRTDSRRKLYKRGDRHAYFAKDDDGGSGDNITVISPSQFLAESRNEAEDWNNMSYVLKVTHGGTSIILGGDAGSVAWDNIVQFGPTDLSCLILKASHHGRLSGYHSEAVRKMAPRIAILSIGEDCEHEAYEEYKKHCKYVLSTYSCGDITFTIDAEGDITPEFSVLATNA